LLVVLSRKLDPVGLFNSDAELSASFTHRLVDLVSSVEIILLVDKDPLLSGEVDGLLDPKPSKLLLIAADHLTLFKDLRRAENLSFHLLSTRVNL